MRFRLAGKGAPSGRGGPGNGPCCAGAAQHGAPRLLAGSRWVLRRAWLRSWASWGRLKGQQLHARIQTMNPQAADKHQKQPFAYRLTRLQAAVQWGSSPSVQGRCAAGTSRGMPRQRNLRSAAVVRECWRCLVCRLLFPVNTESYLGELSSSRWSLTTGVLSAPQRCSVLVMGPHPVATAWAKLDLQIKMDALCPCRHLRTPWPGRRCVADILKNLLRTKWADSALVDGQAPEFFCRPLPLLTKNIQPRGPSSRKIPGHGPEPAPSNHTAPGCPPPDDSLPSPRREIAGLERFSAVDYELHSPRRCACLAGEWPRASLRSPVIRCLEI